MNKKKIIVLLMAIVILFTACFFLTCKIFGEKTEDDLMEVTKEDVVEASVLGVREDTYEYLKPVTDGLKEKILKGEVVPEKDFLEIKTRSMKAIEDENSLDEEKYLFYQLYSSNSDYKLFRDFKLSKDICPGSKDIYDYKKRALDSLASIEMALDGDFTCSESLDFQVQEDLVDKCRVYLDELEASMEAMLPLKVGFYNEMMEELDLIADSKLERQLLEASKYSVRHYMAYSLGEDVSADSGKFLDISKELLDRAKLLISIMEE